MLTNASLGETRLSGVLAAVFCAQVFNTFSRFNVKVCRNPFLTIAPLMHFIDCPNCNKRVRDAATRCHHCGEALSKAVPEHAEGGYDEATDEFDYEEYLEREFENRPPIRKIWVYVAWVLVFAMLFPVALQIIAAFRAI